MISMPRASSVRPWRSTTSAQGPDAQGAGPVRGGGVRGSPRGDRAPGADQAREVTDDQRVVPARRLPEGGDRVGLGEPPRLERVELQHGAQRPRAPRGVRRGRGAGAQDLADLLQAGDVTEQVRGPARHLLDEGPVRGGERAACVVALGDLRGEQQRSHLREDRRRLGLPGLLAHRGAEVGQPALDPLGAPDGGGAGEGHDLREGPDAAGERLAQEDALGVDQAPLLERRVQRAGELLGRAGLGEEPEDAPLVDRRDRRVEVGLPREEHPDGVGRQLGGGREERGAVHLRHAHVGDDDVEGRAGHQVEPGPAGGRGLDARAASQADRQALQDQGRVVDQQDPRPAHADAAATGSRPSRARRASASTAGDQNWAPARRRISSRAAARGAAGA